MWIVKMETLLIGLRHDMEHYSRDPDNVELTSRITEDLSLETMRTEEFADLLRTAFLRFREDDMKTNHYFMSIGIAGICAEIGLLPHTKLAVEIGLWRGFTFPNIRNMNPDRLAELAYEAMKDEHTRKNAISILGTLPDKYCLKTLLEYLPKPEYQFTTIWALAKKDRTDAIEPLMQIFDAADKETQGMITYALSEIAGKQAYDSLRLLLDRKPFPNAQSMVMSDLIRTNALQAKIDLEPYISDLEPKDQISWGNKIDMEIKRQSKY